MISSMPKSALRPCALVVRRSLSSIQAQRNRNESVEDIITARNVWEQGKFQKMEFTIPESAPICDVVSRFANHDIGCLVTTNDEGKATGVVSESDYVDKVALLGRKSQHTKIKDIATSSESLITAKPSDAIETCMEKMLAGDIRHLPLLDKRGNIVGMLSIKDLINVVAGKGEKSLNFFE